MPHTGRMDDPLLENWHVQLRKGLLELCILNALHGSRLYGYDIVKRIRNVDGLVIGEGTVYPILSRFRKQELVATTIEESPDGPPRKYYALTWRGEQFLKEMNDAWRRITSGIDELSGNGNGKVRR